jgi:hypothetical protein
MNSCGIYNFHLVELPPVDNPPEAFFCFVLSPDRFFFERPLQRKSWQKETTFLSLLPF